MQLLKKNIFLNNKQMNSNFSKMKTIKPFRFLVPLSVFLIFGTNLTFSQNQDSTKTVKIKIIKEVDGVTTITDTTYEVGKNEEEPQVLFSSGKKQGEEVNNQNYFDDSKSNNYQNSDEVKYLSDELNNVVNSISASLPVFTSYVDDNGMKVFLLTNAGGKDIELMRKCNNSIYFDDEEIIIPTIKLAENENSTDILIIKQKCGDEVEVEKIEIPRVPAPVIDIVETENGGKKVIISNEKNEVVDVVNINGKNSEEEQIQTLFGGKKQQSINKTENTETTEIKSDENSETVENEENISLVVVESTDTQLKKLQDKNIVTELDKDIENLIVENFIVTNNSENKQIIISFSTEKSQDVAIKIFDIDGNLITSETVDSSNGEFLKSISNEKISKGIYFIQIIQNSKIETRHFIVS